VENREQREHRKQENATRARHYLDKASAPLTKSGLDLVELEFAKWLPQDDRC